MRRAIIGNKAFFPGVIFVLLLLSVDAIFFVHDIMSLKKSYYEK